MSSSDQIRDVSEEPTRIVARAEFDPKLMAYEYWGMMLLLLATGIGLAVMPFWALGLGQWRGRRYYESLSCVATERTLEFGRSGGARRKPP